MDTLEANHQVAVSVMLLICQHSNTFVPALIKGSNWTNWTLIGLSAPGRVREQPLHRRPPLFLRARAAAAPRMGRAGAGPEAPTGGAEGSGERRMRSGAGSRGAGSFVSAGARPRGAGRERAEESRGELERGKGRARVLPSGGAAPSCRRGVLAAGPPIRAGPAL